MVDQKRKYYYVNYICDEKKYQAGPYRRIRTAEYLADYYRTLQETDCIWIGEERLNERILNDTV